MFYLGWLVKIQRCVKKVNSRQLTPFVIWLSLALSACVVSENDTQPRVVGKEMHGSDPLNRYLVYVALSVSNYDSYRHSWCSGILLSQRHVLLAAHCLIGTWRAQVLVGYRQKIILSDGSSFTAKREASSYVAPRSYLKGATAMSFVSSKAIAVISETALLLPRKTVLKDLAILELATPFNLPYQLDYLIPDDGIDLSGERVTIAGYGNGRSGQGAGVARKAHTRVTKDHQRSDVLEFTNFLRKINFGDSGGPVWWKDRQGRLNLVGIHALGIPLIKFHSFALDIRQHRQWLTDAQRVVASKNPVINDKMDMIKRYLPGFTADYYENNEPN